MKMAIIGTGNVGVMHGWVLSEAGVDVTHVVRPGSLAKYVHNIPLDVLDLRKDTSEQYRAVYTPKVVDDIGPGDGYELVMVATNHLQAVAAVRDYKDRAPDACFLLFCANWEGPSIIDDLLPRNRFLWGYSVFSGARGKDGILYANIQKTYRIGELPGSPPGMLDRIDATFAKAGIRPEIKENIIEWLWVHHAINAGLLGNVLILGALPPGDAPPDVWVTMVRSVKDALNVLDKRGVDYRKYPDSKMFQIEMDEEAAKLMQKGLTAAPHYERTRAHSHADTNPAEMKRFYLDVVETGEKLGVDMPSLAGMKEKILAL